MGTKTSSSSSEPTPPPASGPGITVPTLKRARIAVAPRPGVDRSVVERAVDAEFTWLDMPLLDISGTLVRERVRAGNSVRFLVSDAVWRYVVDNDLYGR